MNREPEPESEVGRTWVGVGCERCEAEVPVVAAVLGAGVYRNPRMRLPLFTRWQLGEVHRFLVAGIDCLRCGSALPDPDRALVVWVPPPADLEALRFAR